MTFATITRSHEDTKTRKRANWFRAFALSWLITGRSNVLLARTELLQQGDGAGMGQLNGRLEAEQIGAGGRCRSPSAGGRAEHGRRKRREAAPVLHVDARAVLDEELDDGVVAERRRHVQGGVASLADGLHVAAQADGLGDRFAHAAFW